MLFSYVRKYWEPVTLRDFKKGKDLLQIQNVNEFDIQYMDQDIPKYTASQHQTRPQYFPHLTLQSFLKSLKVTFKITDCAAWTPVELRPLPMEVISLLTSRKRQQGKVPVYTYLPTQPVVACFS